MKEHPIDTYFRNNLEQHALPVSDAIWDKIASELPRKKNRTPLYYSIAAASVAFVMALLFWPNPQQQYQPVAKSPLQEQPLLPTPLELELQRLTDNPAAMAAQTPVILPKKSPTTQTSGSLEPAALDENAFTASLQAIEQTLVEWADSSTAPKKNILVMVELAKPKSPTTPPDPELPVATNPDAQSFNLRDYSTSQLNNLIHGEPLESPFKGTQSLMDNPSVGKIAKFFKSQFE